MTDKVQAVGLICLATIALAALWVAGNVLTAHEPSTELIQAATALVAVATAVVTGIAGFLAGRSVTAGKVGPVDVEVEP